MKKLLIVAAGIFTLSSLAGLNAVAQSYSAPGNDYVRQHPSADPALWKYCQSHYQTDPRCYAVSRPENRGRH